MILTMAFLFSLLCSAHAPTHLSQVQSSAVVLDEESSSAEGAETTLSLSAQVRFLIGQSVYY
jgi:hypothetical protein